MKLIGQVDDIEKLIADSLFVLLPLRIGSGTRTRILEAAALKKAVVTTTIGAEGLEFFDGEMALADDQEGLARHIKRLLADPGKTVDIGERLYASSKALYDEDVVSERLIGEIEGYTPRGMKIAILTNRFYPEVGGAETNIYFQARKLADDFSVSVICPRRILKPRRETTDGFETFRLYDVLNPTNRVPSIKTKTLTPAVFFKILLGGYDVIMCFPALSYNNMLAFIAAKIMGKPIILCCFDWVDYAHIMKTQGVVDPDILADYFPGRRASFFLRRFDHVFCISDKEIEFCRRYNANVDYSPVPVLAWLRHCDIHVIAVRFMNSGAVVVESWASGTPVIQSDVVDPNLVQDGGNGFLFARGSVEGLSRTMVRAFSGRDTLAEMGKAGFELVRQKYTYEHLIDLYRQTFKDVLSRKSMK